MNADWGVRCFLAAVMVLWLLKPAPEEPESPMVGWVRPDKFGIEIEIPLLNWTRMLQLGLREDGVCVWRFLPGAAK